MLQSTTQVLLRTTKYSTFSKYCAYHAKWHLNFTKYCAYHEKWHLTFTKYCACHTEWLAGLILLHIWNVISNARRNKCHPPNSPNTAPATQNDHPTSGRNLRKTAETSFPMRGRSETVPRPFRAWSETVSVSPQPATPPRLLFTLRTNGLYWKIQHFALRLSFQISPSTAPTTKSDTWTSPSTAPTTQSDTWTSPSIAPTTKTDTWPSPSTAPATQNDSQAWSSSHMKRHFQCAQKQMSPSKLTKYCACHAKWPSNIWQKFAENSWNVISNARPIRDRSETVPSMIRDRFRQSATRHATEVTFRAPDERFVLKNTTFRAPAIFPNFTKYCAYHEKWHLNFTKYCAYHAKWHLNFTKYCAYHENWQRKTAETSFPMRGRSETVPRPFRAWSETVSVSPQPATPPRLLFTLRTNGLYWKIQHFALRLSFQISPSTAPTTKSDTWTSPSTAPTTQSDTWTSPSTAPTTKTDTWTSPSTAPTTKSDTWPSPSTAPATQNDSQAWSSSHMKRHFQCAQKQIVTLQTHQILRLPRKMTIQHLAEICGKQLKRHFQCAADPRPFRDRSEHDPRPFPSVRNPPRNRSYFSRSGRTVCIEKYNISRSGYLSKFHQVLRLPLKVTLELHQVLRLPRKVTLELHQVLRLPRKVTLELHQVLRLPRKVTLELHQVLRLPRKVTL